MSQTVFITGAAGYVGAMLVREFAVRPDVMSVIALDKEEKPEMLENIPKLYYLQKRLEENDWQKEVAARNPTIVIHAAWQIRELYGNQKRQWNMNIGGSDNVFDFSFGTPSVTKLVYFSSVASYGSYPQNSIEHRFSEAESLRKSDYLYAEEKRISEEHLQRKYKEAGARVQVAVIRPVAITGPRGRFMRVRFGLQAALSGQLRGSFLYRLISLLVSFVPVTKNWCRQFIHEDDVVAIVSLLALNASKAPFDTFNLAPPGPVVRGSDMARAVGKRALRVHPYLVRLAFFIMWHLSLGSVPTSRGAWKGYSYPIVVDGSKLTKTHGYNYRYRSYDAFYYTNGRYEGFVPKELQRHA